ncbi:hypothetical protein KCP78_03000 [Salmonella enterica subsp. enterica]|nr:hypothetical protein KCP78_03000 [Salmonella enterica subsp. enterica]
MASSDSCTALSIKPQVLTITISASSWRGTTSPSVRSSVGMRSESTGFQDVREASRLWLVGYIIASLKVFIYWNGQGGDSEYPNKNYRNLIRSGGINRCGYQQKVKR